MDTSQIFPECVYLGGFHSPQLGDIVACLPIEQGGFCLHFPPKAEQEACCLVENMVLTLLDDTPAALLHIHIIDFSSRPRFAFLNQLKNEKLCCRTLLDGQAALQAFNELENIVRHRYHTLFQNGEHFWQYNARSLHPESSHVLIINTACFPELNGLSVQRLQDFIGNAGSAGVYVIALHNQNETSSNNVFTDLPVVRWCDGKIHTDNNLLPTEALYHADFTFHPIKVNVEHILNHFRQRFILTSVNSENFLNIKIGHRQDGSIVYLTLGNACGCHHVLLLGDEYSGKNFLLNNIITGIGEQYHAQQIRLYLMDHQNGLALNVFHEHPNVEKLFFGSESNLQPSMDFLKQVQVQIEQRNELFRDVGVKNLAEYNQKFADMPLSHIVVVIDEFQVLLHNHAYAQNANTLLESIGRYGRATGINLLLSTQSLCDVHFMASTLNQIDVRIACAMTDESVLGEGVFQQAEVITTLPIHHAVLQQHRHQDILCIDRQQDYETRLRRIRLSRFAHLQTKPEILNHDDGQVMMPSGVPVRHTIQVQAVPTLAGAQMVQTVPVLATETSSNLPMPFPITNQLCRAK